jgi:hypothetical protein
MAAEIAKHATSREAATAAAAGVPVDEEHPHGGAHVES